MSHYPLLYQVNVRVHLNAMARVIGREATLDDILDQELSDWAAAGFEWIWLLSVWQTGPAARQISRDNLSLQSELQKVLPDLIDQDIGGSGFAIQQYEVSRELGGNESLQRLRSRMQSHGLKLMLDFVPNHMAPDHAWVDEQTNYFVMGTEEDLHNQPHNYRRTTTRYGDRIIAMGRDPNFPGWADTLQLNYGNLALQQAMLEELQRISELCDGVRCDMAMLILPAVFRRTWGIETQAFWPNAIRRVRESRPDFVFMAEVYWDLEWELQQQGFDYCYDKRFYDRLRGADPQSIRMHLIAGLDYQNRLARFLENHDETRAATAFSLAKHRAAAVLTYLAPGLRFFHQGQLEGHRQHISPHLIRGPVESTDSETANFYDWLLGVLRLPTLRDGCWSLLEAQSTTQSGGSHQNIVAYQWSHSSGNCLLVAVNYCGTSSRAYVKTAGDLVGRQVFRFESLWDGARKDRSVEKRVVEGLPLELPPWGIYLLST